MRHKLFILCITTFSLFVTSAAIAASCVGTLCTIEGTSGPDTINGTSGADVICGLGGNDTISGLGGNDRICGGTGDDELNGGAGSDWIHGDEGNNTINGGSGTDTVSYMGAGFGVTILLTEGTGTHSPYTDSLAEIENVEGSLCCADFLEGNNGNNVLKGFGGDDTLDAWGGTDSCDGGNGEDSCYSCESFVRCDDF